MIKFKNWWTVVLRGLIMPLETIVCGVMCLILTPIAFALLGVVLAVVCSVMCKPKHILEVATWIWGVICDWVKCAIVETAYIPIEYVAKVSNNQELFYKWRRKRNQLRDEVMSEIDSLN